jgi:hypothetical protein
MLSGALAHIAFIRWIGSHNRRRTQQQVIELDIADDLSGLRAGDGALRCRSRGG